MKNLIKIFLIVIGSLAPVAAYAAYRYIFNSDEDSGFACGASAFLVIATCYGYVFAKYLEAKD